MFVCVRCLPSFSESSTSHLIKQLYLCSFLANLSSFNVIYDEDLYVLETFTFGDISLNRVNLTIAMEEIIKGMHL